MSVNWRVTLSVAIVIVFVVSALITLSNLPTTQPNNHTTFVSQDPQEALIDMRISSMAMSPQEIRVKNNSAVTLTIRSVDEKNYTFVEPESGIELPVVAGESTQITFTARKNLVFEAHSTSRVVGVSEFFVS